MNKEINVIDFAKNIFSFLGIEINAKEKLGIKPGLITDLNNGISNGNIDYNDAIKGVSDNLDVDIKMKTAYYDNVKDKLSVAEKEKLQMELLESLTASKEKTNFILEDTENKNNLNMQNNFNNIVRNSVSKFIDLDNSTKELKGEVNEKSN